MEGRRGAVALPAGLAPALARALRQGTAAPAVSWSQQAEITATSGASGDLFGYSVAVRGSTALVGAWGKNSGTGAAYVFVRSGTTWTQQAELTASDGMPKDEFGTSVALSGTTALVGAPSKNSFTGAAYVFVRSGTTWSQQAELTASDRLPGDNFGVSVALSGSTALVGAPLKNGFTGAAYVFVRSGTTWTQQAEFTDPAPATRSDDFGFSVALSSDTALVGAARKNGFTGAAYVFVRSGTTWTQQAELTDPAPATFSDEFGSSVAVRGRTALVGAVGKNGFTGAAYVFVRSGTTGTAEDAPAD